VLSVPVLDIGIQTLPARVLRHTSPITQQLVFGCMNVHSAAGKIDDITAIPVDRRVVSETWHDEDSVSIRRLRVEGLQVLAGKSASCRLCPQTTAV